VPSSALVILSEAKDDDALDMPTALAIFQPRIFRSRMPDCGFCSRFTNGPLVWISYSQSSRSVRTYIYQRRFNIFSADSEPEFGR
jgi:hypothetical protein